MSDEPANRLENVVDLGYDQESTSEPFTMAFCYPRSGAILIKGALDSVLDHMKQNLEGIYHYRLSHWRRGRKRGRWYIQSPPDTSLSFKEVKRGSNKTYNLLFSQYGRDTIVDSFDSIPHEYIEGFDLFQIGT